MTREELEKIRQPLNPVLEQLFVEHAEEDEYGCYASGLYKFKGKMVFVNLEQGLWHLSASTDHPIGYYELKEIRYAFLPNRIHAAQIFPPREEFVNIHQNCYHLYEVPYDD